MKNYEKSHEKMIVKYLIEQGYSKEIILDVCKEPELNLNESLVKCALKINETKILKEDKNSFICKIQNENGTNWIVQVNSLSKLIKKFS